MTPRTSPLCASPSPTGHRVATLRARVLRVITLALAFVHFFPAQKHLAALLSEPSLTEAWKGVGAACAIVLYLLPPSTQARGIVGLWRARRGLVTWVSLVLVAVHFVPASDHLPKLLGEILRGDAAFGDAWRGLGSLTAVVWFLLPLGWQTRALSRLAFRAPAPTAARSAA